MASNPSQRPTRPQLRSANPVGAPRHDALVLLVDSDRVTQRLVEQAMSKATASPFGFSLEVANDAAAAFDIMSSSPVDLVISETSLADMSGASFIRKLKLERRLRDVPFVFLSAAHDVAARVEAIRAGAGRLLARAGDAAPGVARGARPALVHARWRVQLAAVSGSGLDPACVPALWRALDHHAVRRG